MEATQGRVLSQHKSLILRCEGMDTHPHLKRSEKRMDTHPFPKKGNLKVFFKAKRGWIRIPALRKAKEDGYASLP
ncbi:hypothetical protein KY290_031139 [Solanum tuberosum]|uniref:Uncharacterized protein n=1 Tax=Solanum tuberosum TaxID=4113 RepID=A0ABQ7U9X3_SOLTU|nr:hypothetical protein KY290_031139 [Solanum tuberosum]